MIWVNKLRDKLQSWLEIRPAIQHQYIINETLDYKGNAIKNKIWYRGDSAEIEQLYKQIPNKNCMFWASVPSANMQIRKIHTGLPSIIIDVLVSIVLNNLNDFDFGNSEQNDFWESVVEENKFKKVLERSLKETLYIGDGAFKISFDPKISDFPILEFYSGEKIEIVYERGRIKEVIFKTEYKENDTVYTLNETYGYGYIQYDLKNAYNQPVDLKVLRQTKDLKPVVFDKTFNMAVPLMFFESSRWEGRGQSIFDRKCDDFDAFDEVWSQWMDAIRMGRAKEYLPDKLIPRDEKGGYLLKPNPFDNRFITTQGVFTEAGAAPKAEIVQPIIQHDSYLASYITALDLCLQGLISPSTLGIDMKKLDNADAQREKEKATLYTRSSIIAALEETLPQLVQVLFQAYSTWVNKPYKEVVVDVDFGEYANPSFEAQVETVTKARTATIMSVDAAVDELYGDSKDAIWKNEEIKRIKEELGIAEMTEPAVGNVPAFGEEEETLPMDLEGEVDAADEVLKDNGAGATPIGNNTSGEKLNGAQISSMMNVIAMVKKGEVSRREAISIITSALGISRENAETFIEDKVEGDPKNDSEDAYKQPRLPDDKNPSYKDNQPDKKDPKGKKRDFGFGKK